MSIDETSEPMTPLVRYLLDPCGYRVAYATHGEGPLLVFPAWWVSNVEKDWENPRFRSFFSRLGEHFRILRYDRPGVGLSDRDTAPRTLEAEVDLLAAIIDAAAGGERVFLFAMSCAGPVSIRYAARYPDRVAKICCYGAYLDGADVAAPEVQKAMIEMVRAHWGMGSRILADMFFPGHLPEELETFSRQQRDYCSAEKAAELLQLNYTMDVARTIQQVRSDMLVMHREGDRAIPLCAGRRLAAAAPGTPWKILKGRAHPPWVDGDEILSLTVEFMTGQTLAAEPAEDSYKTAEGSYKTAEGCYKTAEGSYKTADGSDKTASTCRLDAPNRELVTPDDCIALTPLEYGVMQYFVDAAGRISTRDELLEHVWRSPFAGSNKVDAVIRTLRKKLGPYAASIETVPGHGYRFRAWSTTAQ